MEPGNENNANGKHRVVMLPFIAQGHITPFLSFSILLARRSRFTVTIATTPLNILSLRSKIQTTPGAETLDIRLAELPFSSADHGLPPNTENTDSLPPHLITRLMVSFAHVQPHLEELIRKIFEEEGGRAPLCIISDMFCGWTLDVARKFKIPRITLCSSGASAIALAYSVFLHRRHLEAQSGEDVTLPDLPHISFHRSQISAFLTNPGESDEDGRNSGRFFVEGIKKNLNSWGTLFNTVEALEHRMLQHMRTTTGRLVWSVGPLSLLASLAPCQEVETSAACSKWLDSHPPASVLYICFGSQNSISVGNMKELALGLECAGRAFVWVVRPPLGFESTADFSEDILPDGFEERMEEKKQGLIIRGWAPQTRILSHPSTGGFISHCGWNSFVESLSHGVPVLGWPLVGDQFLNSMLAEELGVGVEMARSLDAEVKKEDVEKNVKMLMEEKKGMEMRMKAIQMKDEIVRAVCEGKTDEQKGSSIRDIDDMIDKLICNYKRRIPL